MLGVRSEEASGADAGAADPRRRHRPVRRARAASSSRTKFEGWIEQLLVNATGETVRRGQPLMRVYSPTCCSPSRNTDAARMRLMQSGRHSDEEDASRRLVEGALQRLRNLDVPEEEMQALQRGQAARTITLRSPYAGVVLEKSAFEGMRFMPGEPLYRIADLSHGLADRRGLRTGSGAGRRRPDREDPVKAYPGGPSPAASPSSTRPSAARPARPAAHRAANPGRA